MTKQTLHHKGTPVQPYPDPHGIGQKRLAEIHAELAMQEMGASFMEAFGTQYENPHWRAMKRRMFRWARANHDRAAAILSTRGTSA